MILLWGRPTEAPLAATAAALMRAGAHVRIFDEALAQHADLRFPADSTTDGELRVHGTTIPLAGFPSFGEVGPFRKAADGLYTPSYLHSNSCVLWMIGK